MPQFQDIDTYLQLPSLPPSQFAEPSPLAMLAATCKKIGGSSPPTSLPINTGTRVCRAPSKAVSPTPADCYPTSTAACLTSCSRSTTTTAEPTLCPSVSPPAAYPSTSPATVYQSISPPTMYPSISPPTVYHPASPPLATPSPPSPPCHQPNPMHGVTASVSSPHVHQCLSLCSCSPSAVYPRYSSYPVVYQPYPAYGVSPSLGPMHHRHASPSYTPYSTSANVTVGRFHRCRCPNWLNDDQSTEPTKRRQHVCHIPGCGKVYGKTSHLKAHLRGHAGQRDIVCRWMHCGKDFTRSDELQRHLRTHTGKKRFACEDCGKRFTRSDHLSKHVKAHFSDKQNPTLGEEDFVDVTN